MELPFPPYRSSASAEVDASPAATVSGHFRLALSSRRVVDYVLRSLGGGIALHGRYTILEVTNGHLCNTRAIPHGAL